MQLKPYLAPITRFIASIAKKFIPGYWAYKTYKGIENFGNGKNPYLFPIKLIFGMLVTVAAIVAGVIILAGAPYSILIAASILYLALVVPNFTHPVFHYGQKLFDTIVGLMDLSKKQALQDHGHYAVFQHTAGKVDALNIKESSVMARLYQEKKRIKAQPEGWFGLSGKQKKKHEKLKSALVKYSFVGRYDDNGRVKVNDNPLLDPRVIDLSEIDNSPPLTL